MTTVAVSPGAGASAGRAPGAPVGSRPLRERCACCGTRSSSSRRCSSSTPRRPRRSRSTPTRTTPPPADGTESNLDWPVLPAFLLGLGGLIAMNRITSSAAAPGDVLQAAPTDRLGAPSPSASPALCRPRSRSPGPPTSSCSGWSTRRSTRRLGRVQQRRAGRDHGVGRAGRPGRVAARRAVARWWRWPTAAAITAVGLILWAVLGSVVRDASWWERLPPRLAVRAGASNTEDGPGSRAAATTGASPTSSGCARWPRWPRAPTAPPGTSVAGWCGSPWCRGLTVLALLLTVFTGPEGYYGPWDPRW